MNGFKKNWVFILILLFGICIRLINLDKSSGLWHDEMTLYSIASQKMLSGMISVDTHRFLMFPLYFIVYKLWITLFGNSDLVIRLMSVFFDSLAIASAYFVGRQIAVNIQKNNKANEIGLLNMFFYATNASFIYYAQEAKFYSLTFFIINLLIIFWLKVLENKSAKNIAAFVLLNFVLLYTYTSQSLLIILLMFISILYLFIEKKLKEYISLFIFWGIIFIPLIFLMIIYPKYFSGNFDAVVYDNTFILLVLQNWFSPILEGTQNNVLNYQYSILKNLFNLNFLVFVIAPVIFMCRLIWIGVSKNYFIRFIFAIPILYVLGHILLSHFTSYNALVRYTLMALPFAILCISVGFSEQVNKKSKTILLSIFLAINLLGLFSNLGAVNIKRPEGYKALANLITQNKIKQQNDFILPIRVQLLDKYYKIEGEKFSLYSLNSTEAQKTYLNSDEINLISTKNNLHKHYRRYLSEKKVSPQFEKYIMDNWTKLNNKDLVILVDRSICMFDDEAIAQIVASSDYEKYPLQFLRLSKLNNDLMFVLNKNLKLSKTVSDETWSIYVFKK